MPRGDGTGPNGMGSGTGRSMGYCSGANMPGLASAPGWGGQRLGFGQGGFGRGCRGGFSRGGFRGVWRSNFMGAAPVGPVAGAATPEVERQYLRQQATAMESSLAAIKTRLAKMDDETTQG